MYPSTFFGLFPPFPYEERAFVAMSFDKTFNDRWNNVIVPAVQSVSVNGIALVPHRVDLRSVSDSILTEILDEIRKCRVFIGDITSIGAINDRPIPNPNVMYEVGLAQAVRLPEEVLLFRSDKGERPFDIASIRVHQYDPDSNPTAAKNLIAKSIINSLNELNLQQHLAVKRAAESLDYPSWTVLFEVMGTGSLKHPLTQTMRQVLGAISKANAISKLLEAGAISAELTKVTPRLFNSEGQKSAERLVTYKVTTLGTAIAKFAGNEIFSPEVLPLLEEQYQKGLGNENPS
ncbi:MAG: hypothetical protein ACQ9IQ_03470 [Nitrospirales bacterium]